jgi:hypothetical protein
LNSIAALFLLGKRLTANAVITLVAVHREKLYEEVWAEPMLKVAARYGVSSSYLARVCERMNVPRPGRGYWAQLEVGKTIPRPALPDPRPGDEIEWSRDGEPRRAGGELPKPPANTTPVPRSRRARGALHELLVDARQHFEGVKETDVGYLRPSKRRLVDIYVSKNALERALDTSNRLFLALEDQGHRVALAPFEKHLQRPAVDERGEARRERYDHASWSPDRPTVVYVGTVAIGLTLFELSEETEVEYVDGKYVPTAQIPVAKRRRLMYASTWNHRRDVPSGKLCVRATSPYTLATWAKQWPEAKRGELAAKIPEIVWALESAAGTIAKLVEEGARQAEIRRREWEAQHEKWLREEAERQRQRNIKESREELFAAIEAWGVAKRIEGFFEDAERRAADLGQEDRQVLLDRLTRARTLLGGVDALQRFRSWKAPEDR